MRKPRYLRLLVTGIGTALMLLGFAQMAVVAAAGSDISGAVTQSYNADPAVLPGMVVEFKSKDQATVIPLTNQDIRNMLGVVVPANDAAIVLTPQSVSTQQVLVATSGHYGLLVSNQSGPIKTGDYLTVSALAGISMKADAGQADIIGRATGSFGGSSNVIGTVPLKGSASHGTTVSIGYIPVDVRLAPNPQFKNANILPGFLTGAARSVANKPVSPARVYMSAAVLLATLFMTCSMFYGSVRSSIVATGRNPLAKKAIGRSLVQTTAAALIVFAAGVFGVYLILNL